MGWEGGRRNSINTGNFSGRKRKKIQCVIKTLARLPLNRHRCYRRSSAPSEAPYYVTQQRRLPAATQQPLGRRFPSLLPFRLAPDFLLFLRIYLYIYINLLPCTA